MPIEFTPSRTLLAAMQQFQTQVRADRQQNGTTANANHISIETIEAVLGNGLFQVRGASLPTTGNSPSYEAGEQVYVGWTGNTMTAILGHTSRRAQFMPIPTPGGVLGIVEELFAAPSPDNPLQLDIWFRNYDICTPLKLRPLLTGDPTDVKWGADRKSFLVVTGTGTGRLWWLFKFLTKPGDKVLPLGKSQGSIQFVRGEAPYANPMVLTTITADRKEIRESITAKFINATFTQEVLAIFPSETAPATGLGFHTKEGSVTLGVTDTLRTISTQDSALSLSVPLNLALNGSIPGIFVQIMDYYMDKDLNLILGLLASFTTGIKGDGVLNRTGKLPKAFLAADVPPFGGPDDFNVLIQEDAENPGPDVTYFPTSLPTVGPVTAQTMSPLLAERHIFICNTTKQTILFTTTRPNPNIFDENYIAQPAMSHFESDPFSFPPGAFANRFMGQREEVLVIAQIANLAPPTVSITDFVGSIDYQFALEGAPYSEAYGNLLAFEATGGVPPPGGSMTWQNVLIDLNYIWSNGLIGVSGLKVARADLWNHSLPWIAGGDDALNLGPLPIDHTQDFDYGLVSLGSGVVIGFNALVIPPSIFGMNGLNAYFVIKYSTTAYETRAAIPTTYRAADVRLLQFGSAGNLWIVLEKITNSGSASAPVWGKQIAAYVLRFDGNIVSNPLPWTTVAVSNTPLAHYVADPFYGFYSDGTLVEMLADGPKHIIWAISTLAERDADANFRHIKITKNNDATTIDFGTNYAEYQAEQFKNLGIDFLYKATEPLNAKGRKFIKGWDFKTGAPLLVQGSPQYPQVDGPMIPVSALQGFPKFLDGFTVTISHYHGINDKPILTQIGRFAAEAPDPYSPT